MTLWVMKFIILLIALDPEDAENAQDVDGGTGDDYIRHVTVLLQRSFVRVVISMI